MFFVLLYVQIYYFIHFQGAFIMIRPPLLH